MGLIKAAAGAIGGTLADQWLEFFSVDSLPVNVLVTKGQKTINSRSSNTRGSDNIISNGSGIIVADGQAVAMVSNGVVVEFAADPGHYTFDQSTVPSIFADSGGFGAKLQASFREGVERFATGGGLRSDQRIYYFNTKELIGNKYGTAEPIAYRVVDADIGLDMDVDLRCNGEFSYRLTNPILFYQNVAGNVDGDYGREMIDSQLRSELLTGLNQALAGISAQGIRYSALPGYTQQIADQINEILSAKWRDLRGIEVVSFAVNSVSISDEDEKRIKDLQAMKSLRDPSMAGAALVSAQSDAMRSAAENPGGAAIGFMGLGMASQAGGTSATAAELISQGGTAVPAPGQQPVMNYPIAASGGFAVAPAPPVGPPPVGIPPVGVPVGVPAMPVPMPVMVPPIQGTGDSWFCPNCGQGDNHGNFCSNCGTPRPAPATWDCPNCGQSGNRGNFCSNCGVPKPLISQS
jgi:membrane protease subunit (stomatin/prohibitin family)